MATKTRKAKKHARDLTPQEKALTALQRAALDVLARSEPDALTYFGWRTRDSLLARKLIDRIGRPSAFASPRYVLTPFGRTVLAAHALHEGRARR